MEGLRISPFCQETDLDHGGGSGEDVTEDHVGSPERLTWSDLVEDDLTIMLEPPYLIDVTSHPRLTADLHIREPEDCQSD